jgi:hypothetical protein
MAGMYCDAGVGPIALPVCNARFVNVDLYPRSAPDEQHVARTNQTWVLIRVSVRRRPRKHEVTRMIRSGDEQSNRPQCCNLMKTNFKV